MGIYMGKIQTIGLMMLLLFSVACNGLQNQLNQEIQERLDSSPRIQGQSNSILISCMIEGQLPGVENDSFVECYQTSDITTAAILLKSCEAAGSLSERSLSCRDLHDGQFNVAKCITPTLEAYYHYEGRNHGEFQAKIAKAINDCESADGVWSEL